MRILCRDQAGKRVGSLSESRQRQPVSLGLDWRCVSISKCVRLAARLSSTPSSTLLRYHQEFVKMVSIPVALHGKVSPNHGHTFNALLLAIRQTRQKSSFIYHLSNLEVASVAQRSSTSDLLDSINSRSHSFHQSAPAVNMIRSVPSASHHLCSRIDKLQLSRRWKGRIAGLQSLLDIT